MHSDEYASADDECDDGRQQLQEYEWHCQQIQYKANALLTLPAAAALARSVGENLTKLVQQHAMRNGRTMLLAILRDSIVERILIEQALKGRRDILLHPVSADGSIALTDARDDACVAFEALLAAEPAR
jgi:hypothetical protein